MKYNMLLILHVYMNYLFYMLYSKTQCTKFVNASKQDTDMQVKMKKTFTQLMWEQDPVEAPTTAELTAKELTL